MDIPYPPTKGNAVDLYYKLKYLQELGVEITLVCFYKELADAANLLPFCYKLYLIPRKKLWQIKNLHMPLFVQSRRGEGLLHILLEDDAPILFDGLHCVYYFNDPRIATRKKYVRLHNIESEYYQELATIEKNWFKKLYYWAESKLSHTLESNLLHKTNGLFSVSSRDKKSLDALHIKNIYLPPFISTEIKINAGMGSYALYHADMSINENEASAFFLINQLFNEITFPLKIAGRKCSAWLKRKAAAYTHIEVIDSPSMDDMDLLIKNSQIILCPFLHASGFKIKLLESLRSGRYIIADEMMREILPAGSTISFVQNNEEWKKNILAFSNKPFTQELIIERTYYLRKHFNSVRSAEDMIKTIFV